MVDSVSTFLMKCTMHRWYFAFDSIELAVKTYPRTLFTD